MTALSTAERASGSDEGPANPDATPIPKEPYVSAEWLALEYERLWPRVWQMACRLEEIPEVGDFIEYTIGDQSVLIVRQGDTTIKAFNNACLHQGTRLRSGCGSTAELQCPFHGWSWHIDGSMLEIPDLHEFGPDCVKLQRLRLPEVHLDTWGGFVFVNFERDPESLLDYLAPIPERLAPFEFEKMRLTSYRTSIMECNWKTAVHSFNEGYHLEATHVWNLADYRRNGDTAMREPTPVDCDSVRGRPNTRDAEGRTIGSYAFSYEVFETHNLLRDSIENMHGSPLLSEFADPRAAALAALLVREEMGLVHQAEVDYVRELDEIPTNISLHDFMVQIRRVVGQREGTDYSHISDDDLLANIDYFFYPNLIGPGTAGHQIIYRVRPNGTDPHTCLFDVMQLRRFPAGAEPPKVEHEWYPDWRDFDWYSAVGQHFATMGYVQAGMRQRSFTSIHTNRMEAGNRNHHRFVERYVVGDSGVRDGRVS